MTNINLCEKISEQMVLDAQQAYPYECCGILIGKIDGSITVSDIRKANNLVTGAQNRCHFEMDPMFLYQVEREIERSGLEIVGFYHSHPDCKAVPSEQDLHYMIPGLVYAILSVTKDGVADIQYFQK
ncbi:Mov34/MPN/PAD-1 family protein [Fibrobacter sp. UWH4]|uniref:Mov34/MPN/PAD-1 family protein n=1 Tax=Fibrobacter sp. UWH4 TaxID=1896210 RepID=UPI00091E2306|nr:M67 family metallopeptidase [Fibrobacter sp. UWH4]SHK56732.1 Proteasome lid subunit RPN8/RPN11, contains Jab1/MPN metalloenzyme (JAMM) motif [Fibrobacter sp. UWH4]